MSKMGWELNPRVGEDLVERREFFSCDWETGHRPGRLWALRVGSMAALGMGRGRVQEGEPKVEEGLLCLLHRCVRLQPGIRGCEETSASEFGAGRVVSEPAICGPG